MIDAGYFSLICGIGLASLLSYGCLHGLLLILSPRPIEVLPSERKCRTIKDGDELQQDLQEITTCPSANVDLSIVIPAFNEVPRLPFMLASAIKHLSDPSFSRRTYEILVVDDGSSDGTADLTLDLARKYPLFDIRVISLRQNQGKGAAVRHGMLHSRGRRLLMVDADDASCFADLEVLWEEMDKLSLRDGRAIVVGSRAHLVNTEAVVKRSFLRNMAMRGLHLTLRIIGVGHVRDTQCGFKLFSREAARMIFPYQRLSGWIFDVEILLLAEEQGIPVAEVPINWHEVPESKLRLMRDSLLMLRDLLVLRTNHLTGVWEVPGKTKKE